MVTYERLKEIYDEVFAIKGLNTVSIGLLYNLIGYLYLAYKKKDPNLTVYDLFYKIAKTKSFDQEKEEFVWVKMTDFDDFVIPFSIQLEHLIEHNHFKPNPQGLTDVKTIVNEINNILDEWLPF